MINATWCISSNIGDNLTPYIIRQITGSDPVYAQGGADYEHYVLAGSMLNHANRNSIVWGAGLANITDGVNGGARLHAVRGPISRMRALSSRVPCPQVFGDPAILLPELYFPHIEKKYDIGIVPHYVDQFRAATWYTEGQHIINALQPVEDFVDAILECSSIVSSSLHGIIVAHAYGIPALWVKMSDSIGGDDTKYRDYYMSVGMDTTNSVDLRENHEIPAIKLEAAPDMTIMREKFWNACPLPMEKRLEKYRRG